MKILAISDVHGEENENLYKYLENNDIDLVIITGDITDFGPLEFVGEFIGKIFEYDCDVIAIPGNCDPAGICNAIGESGAFCLHNEIVGYGDAILFGYGGSNPTPFDTPGEIDDLKIYGDVFELMANYDYVYNKDVPKVKILVTHAPPFNTEADLTAGGDHVGSSGILKSIHEFEPQVNICGHIHEGRGIESIGETVVINPGSLGENGFYAWLEVEKSGENWKVVNSELCEIK